LDERTVLAFGALLHDIGKPLYRGISGGGTHSELGADFISQEIAPLNEDFASEAGQKVSEQIRFHHHSEMAGAKLSADSLAYITYFADNISAGMDRKDEGCPEGGARFNRHADLQKVFNILRGSHDRSMVPHRDYNATREILKKQLVQIRIAPEEVNSLLNILEATCSDIPSSTDTSQLMDISLYDHAKTTAALAACILDWLAQEGVTDYRQALFDKASSAHYYEKRMFLIVSCDTSGIQDFIYTISGTGALKQLRARSLYLEMLLEDIADELLERLQLSRANLLYSGGGNVYLILPNTQQVKTEILDFQKELKGWVLSQYGTDLYLAVGWAECSANDLANRGGDGTRFQGIFRNLARNVSDSKAARYIAEEIGWLNFGRKSLDAGRECTECHRVDHLLTDSNICEFCESLHAISKDLIYKDVFAVIEKTDPASHKKAARLALPFGRELAVFSRKDYLASKPHTVRVYTKNSWDAGVGLATHIWMGDYTADQGGKGISSYAEHGETLEADKGIKRLGVLRADVDDLGAAFSSGFPKDKASISRTATLSRLLGFFFKHKINDILKKGQYQAQIIYSGGDDLFIIGNWSDIIYAALDIDKALHEFTDNDSLSISAGIGMFPATYPIARMADETGELVDAAKMHVRKDADGTMHAKDAVALWSKEDVLSWDELAHEVEPRMRELADIFSENDKGKAFIYKMVSLLRHYDENVSAPRLAYLLARSFEKAHDSQALCRKFYGWVADERKRRCLVLALEWYVYSIRERG
jgi:CRISPR-associated protein Csm1